MVHEGKITEEIARRICADFVKKSKDERIKEDIISLVNEFWERIGSINPEYSSRSEMLAWLEKQGEQKAVKFDNTNVKRMFIKALERVEEQNNKGYKLTDCDKNSWWEDFKAYCGYTEMQKPAWSEEDEGMCIFTIKILNNIHYKDNANWLKSLKERIKGE